MQSIERYGLVALLFLAVTVVAVFMWGGDPDAKREVAAASPQDQFTSLPDSDDSSVLAGSTRATRNRPVLRSAPMDDRGESPSSDAGRRAGAAPHNPFAPSQVAGRIGELGSQAREELGKAANQIGERALEARRDLKERLMGEEDPREDAVESTPRPKVHSGSGGAMNIHVVASGETLSEISLDELGTSRRWQEIVELNPGINPDRLVIGARLRLPAAGNAHGAAPASRDNPSTTIKGPTWRVAKGESLWVIASKALGDGNRYKELERLNPKLDSMKLKVGQVIHMPEGSTPQSATRGVVAATSESRQAEARSANGRGGRVH